MPYGKLSNWFKSDPTRTNLHIMRNTLQIEINSLKRLKKIVIQNCELCFIYDVKIKSLEGHTAIVSFRLPHRFIWRMRATRNDEARRAAPSFFMSTHNVGAHATVYAHIHTYRTHTRTRVSVYNTAATRRRHVIGPVLSRGLASRLI